jgi:hypothetical protein
MSITPSLLCGQDTFRCRNPLLEGRKNSLGTGDNFQEAEGLLPSTPGGGIDGPAFETDPSQTRHVRTTSKIGNRIGRVWVAV